MEPKCLSRIHKNPAFADIVLLVNRVRTLEICLFKFHLILSVSLRLGLPSDVFPLGFPTRILCVLLTHACRISFQFIW